MTEFNQKKAYKKVLYSPLVLFLLLCILLVLIKAFFGVYEKEKMSALKLSRQKAELEKALSRQKTLSDSVSYLKTDKGVEDEMRNKFRVVKDGEMVAVIIDDDSTTTTATSTQEKGFWSGILDLLHLQ